MRSRLLVVILLYLLFNCSSTNVPREINFEKINNFNEWSDDEIDIYNLLFTEKPEPNEDIWNIAKVRRDMLVEEGINISHSGFPYVREYLRMVGFSQVSEIIAYGYSTPESVVNAWLNSPGHYNIIKGDYKYLGICAEDKYYVIIFCN